MIVTIAAALLLAASLAVWFIAQGARPAARLHIRFAGVLFTALPLAIFAMPAAAAIVTLLVLPIALGVLGLAAPAGFGRAPPAGPAAIVLALVCLGGLAAAATGWTILSLAPCAAAIVVLLLVFLRQFDAARAAAVQGLLAALCFLGAVSAFASEGAGAAVLLFAAAGLLGTALALARSDVAVEERPVRDLRGVLAIRGRRQA